MHETEKYKFGSLVFIINFFGKDPKGFGLRWLSLQTKQQLISFLQIIFLGATWYEDGKILSVVSIML
jgi:hypothetical protein